MICSPTLSRLQASFGRNFIGPEQVNVLLARMGLPALAAEQVPEPDYPQALLRDRAADHLLVLGCPGPADRPLDILRYREVFGTDPAVQEPCLYNQDWYLAEDFVRRVPECRWYLLRREVLEQSRAAQPEALLSGGSLRFPPAVLCVEAFFAAFLSYGDYLWDHDFVWCADTDHNGDRIYVGKYHDVDGINKNGFSIHRHLSLRPCYGAAPLL